MKGDWGCAGPYTREHVLTVQVTAQPRSAISRNLTKKNFSEAVHCDLEFN